MPLRRACPAILVVLVAAIAVATAVAKPLQEIDAVVSPAKAGTKKKPRPVQVKMLLTTRTDTAGEAEPTTTKAEVLLPSEFVYGGVRFPSCKFLAANQTKDGCSPKARVSRSGRAVFTRGAFTEQTSVTVYNGPKGKTWLLRLDTPPTAPISIHQALEGKLVKCGSGPACAGHGMKLVISVPEELQQFALTSLELTVKRLTVKKNNVVTPFVGLGPCSDRELSFKAVNTYRGVSEPGVGTDAVDCS